LRSISSISIEERPAEAAPLADGAGEGAEDGAGEYEGMAGGLCGAEGIDGAA
jgi:hypothetical protein